MKEIDKNIVLNLLLLLLLQARLQARQVQNGDKRHHYKGLTCANLFLHIAVCYESTLLELDAMCPSNYDEVLKS
jgi:hypothetical protein